MVQHLSTGQEAAKSLHELRRERGLHQRELGPQVSVSRFERGHLLPGPVALKRMADRLGLSCLDVMAACREAVRRRLVAEAAKATHATARPAQRTKARRA